MYRAGASRVEVEDGAPVEELAAGKSADAAKSERGSGRGSGFGKAGTRTAAQAAMAADEARKQIAALEGKAIIAFSDGACRGNPGPAGSGAYVQLPNGHAWEASLHLGRATNNVAELTAIDLVLDVLEDAGVGADADVVVFSDSSYANGVLVKNWKAKANQALIAELRDRLQTWPNLRLTWIAGHVGVDGNERADELANRGVEGISDRRRAKSG